MEKDGGWKKKIFKVVEIDQFKGVEIDPFKVCNELLFIDIIVVFIMDLKMTIGT